MIVNQKKTIPDRMYIEGCRAWVALRGAVKCFECGLKGHIAKDCKMERTSALARSSTWASKRGSNPTPEKPNETEDREIKFPRLQPNSPIEKTMRYIDSMHDSMQEYIVGGSGSSQGGPEGSQWENPDPTMPENEDESLNMTNVNWTEIVGADDSWRGGANDSWRGEWQTSLKLRRDEGGDPSEEVELESATAKGDTSAQTLSQVDEEIEEGEIVEAGFPAPVSPLPEGVAPKERGDGMTKEIEENNMTSAEVFHSFTSTPISTPKTERRKKNAIKKVKRKRQEGSNSGDRRSSELKRKTLSKTEMEKIVDTNIRTILGEKH